MSLATTFVVSHLNTNGPTDSVALMVNEASQFGLSEADVRTAIADLDASGVVSYDSGADEVTLVQPLAEPYVPTEDPAVDPDLQDALEALFLRLYTDDNTFLSGLASLGFTVAGARDARYALEQLALGLGARGDDRARVPLLIGAALLKRLGDAMAADQQP